MPTVIKKLKKYIKKKEKNTTKMGTRFEQKLHPRRYMNNKQVKNA